MSFGIYIAGYLIVIGGLAYGAILAHVSAPWIVAGALGLAGFGIVTGEQVTRQKESAN